MIVNKPKKKKQLSRFTVFNIIMATLFTVIMGKLLYIQVYKHDDYREKADVGSTRLIAEKAPRGKILDSDGNVLATNIQTYSLTYTQTEESDKNFYSTMDKMFKVLKENGETYQDDLLIKIDSSGNYYYDFKTDDSESRKAVELRFKKDRGIDEKVKKDLVEKKLIPEKGDLSDKQNKLIDDELLKITPEEGFYELVKIYSMYDLLIEREEIKLTDEGIEKAEIRSIKSSMEEEFLEMSGKDITEKLLQHYSINEIRNYMVIKDAIKMQSFKGYRAVTIASNIKKETAFIFYQMISELPGLDVSLEPIRYYPYNHLGSAVIGYVSSIDSSKEKNYEMRGYDVSSDLIGVAGIEAAFEHQLKGVKGGTTVKVNSKGRVTEELFKLESYPGNDVQLTIDKDVQYAAQEAMKDTLAKIQSSGQKSATRGAAVAIEVKTGRVIAMVSYPDYDPNLFSVPGRLTPEETEKYFNPDLEKYGKEHIAKTGAQGTLDELFPKNDYGIREDQFDLYPRSFFNYATQGLQPPGSVFKPLTSLIGLKEGIVSENEIIVDRGKYLEHPEIFGEGTGPECMIYTTHRGNHGPTDLRRALQVSCNYYYYELGYRMYTKYGSNKEALDTIAKHAWEFGLGVPYGSSEKTSTGIEIEEYFGQTYNFQSFKNARIDTALFSLVPDLEKGTYGGIVYFVPFDIEKNEDDPDDLKELKIKLKDKIIGALEKVGTDKQLQNTDAFAEDIVKDVLNIMKVSQKYKNNVANYEKANNTKVNINEQAAIVANSIARFVVNDMTTEILSPSQLIYAAIGQSSTNYTPVQIANYTATLANGGTRYKVHLVDKVISPTGEVIQEFKPEVEGTVDIPPQYLQAIKEGMYRVNTDPSNGTAYNNFANFPIKVAGKTGTADFGTEEQYRFQGRQPYGNFISFAPLEDPEIAVFVTVYDGKKGSESSSVTKAIYEAYFKDRLLQMDPAYGSKSATFKKYVLDSPLKDNKGQVEVKPENPPVTKPEDKPEQ